MLGYYTVEKKVRIKTAVVSLWFDVAHLTDSLLEAIKVCQGGWQWGQGDYSPKQLSREKMSICSSQSERKFVCMPMGGKSERCESKG